MHGKDRFLSNRLRVDDVLKNSGDDRYPGSPSSINKRSIDKRTSKARGRQAHRDMATAGSSRQGSYQGGSRSHSSSVYSDDSDDKHRSSDKHDDDYYERRREPNWTSSKQYPHDTAQYSSDSDGPSHSTTSIPPPPAPARFEYFKVIKTDHGFPTKLNTPVENNENQPSTFPNLPGYRKGNYRPPIPATWNRLNPAYGPNEPKGYDHAKRSGYYRANHPIHEGVDLDLDNPSTSSPSSSESLYATPAHINPTRRETPGHNLAIPGNHHIASNPAAGAAPISSPHGAIVPTQPPQMANAPHCPARPAPAPPKNFLSGLTRSKNKKEEDKLQLPVRQPPARMSEVAQAA
ncbi:hypothetical protein AA313_de0204134 [Arthrobotrys entomopaga]|nr:hypothetical protein AA313_de0204134 [Arthrobotrys entomopaga]